MNELDALLADEPIAGPSLTGAKGLKGTRTPDLVIARRNRLNRNRGKGTSKDLARYLGPDWQNVETLNWPWDVQGPGGRIQSKRDLGGYGPVAALRVITTIPEGDWLRALYYVAPARRLASGEMTVLLDEWVQQHGWTPPAYGVVLRTPTDWLLRLPIALFRDVHCAQLAEMDR